MRSVYRSSKSALFLIELIIAIAFFSLASAICVQLFAKAHTLSANSRNLSMAMNVVQNAAEEFKGAQAPGDLFGGAVGTYVQQYDNQWTPVEQGKGAFFLEVTYDRDGALLRADIVVKDEQGESIYGITSKKYLFVD